jgi:hypothetical protein
MCHFVRQEGMVNVASALYHLQQNHTALRQRKYHFMLLKLYYFQAYKALDDTHFEPFVVVESGGELGVRTQEIFKKVCNLIT